MLIIDGDECSRKIAIKLINIEDLSSVTLVPDTQVNTCQMVDPTFYVDEVNTDSVILEQKGDRWIYDIATRQLRLLATATPGP